MRSDLPDLGADMAAGMEETHPEPSTCNLCERRPVAFGGGNWCPDCHEVIGDVEHEAFERGQAAAEQALAAERAARLAAEEALCRLSPEVGGPHVEPGEMPPANLRLRILEAWQAQRDLAAGRMDDAEARAAHLRETLERWSRRLTVSGEDVAGLLADTDAGERFLDRLAAAEARAARLEAALREIADIVRTDVEDYEERTLVIIDAALTPTTSDGCLCEPDGVRFSCPVHGGYAYRGPLTPPTETGGTDA